VVVVVGDRRGPGHRRAGREGWSLALAAAAVLALLAAPPALAGPSAAETSRRAAELYRAGRYQQALPLFEKALKEAEAAYHKDRQRLAVALSNLGELHRQLGRLPEAETLLRRAVDLADAPEGGTRGLGSSLNNLALLYRDQSRYGEALARQERALAVFEGSFGRNHPNAAKARENLKALRRLMGEPEEGPRTKRVLVWRPRDDGKARPARVPAAKNLSR
jgi:tetratricopeptide (TPR) repeat protein